MITNVIPRGGSPSVGGNNSGTGDCCCSIQELCWDTDDPNYNPCGVESDLKITANFTEGIPTAGDAGIIIGAQKIMQPNGVNSDLVGYTVINVLGASSSSNTQTYNGYADMLSGLVNNQSGEYSITAKKVTGSNYLITIKGATQEELGFDALESEKWTMLFKNIPGIQQMPKRLALLNDLISDIEDITGGFTFMYSAITTGSPATWYWLSETKYKFETMGNNKFFNGKKMLKKVWNNCLPNEVQELKFTRELNFNNDCQSLLIEKGVIVQEAQYPFTSVDIPVNYPIKISVTTQKTQG